MLMEPDEYTSQERALTDKAKELIEQHELDWGNGECFIQRDAGHSELYMTLEAPNHATVTVTVPAEADEKGLRRAMADGLLDFDPDEEFDECWSREFAARNGFTPSGFLSGLQEDKAYFGLRSEALLHPGQSNAGQGNETIAEIRWTEEDLRHWLKDHDWPDNNENMDAMRDMISARELRDRSIEEGWEIIDADLPPDNALRIRVTDVLTEYGFTDIDVKAPDRTPEGIWIGFEAMQPVRLDVTSAQEGRSVSFTLTAAEANDWRSGRLDAHGLSRLAVERVLARPGDTVTLAYGDSLFRPGVARRAGPRRRLGRPTGNVS